MKYDLKQRHPTVVTSFVKSIINCTTGTLKGSHHALLPNSSNYLPRGRRVVMCLISLLALTACSLIGGPPDHVVQAMFTTPVEVEQKTRCALADGDREHGITERWAVVVRLPEFNDKSADVFVRKNGVWMSTLNLDVAQTCPNL